MNAKSTRRKISWGVALVGLLIVSVWCYREVGGGNSAGSGESGLSQDSRREATDEVAKRKDALKRAEHDAERERFVQWQKRLDEPHITLQQIDQYLSSEGRSSSALVFSLLLYPREAIVQELRGRSDDPVACLYLATSVEGVERLKWADNLIASAPQNPLGYLLKASSLAESGRAAAALEQVGTAFDLGDIDAYQDQINGHFSRIEGIAPTDSVALDYLSKSETWLQKALRPTLQAGVYAGGAEPAVGMVNFQTLLGKYESFDNSKLNASLAIAGRKISRELSKDKSFASNKDFGAFQKKIDLINSEAESEVKARYEYLKALSKDEATDQLTHFAGQVKVSGWPEASALKPPPSSIEK